MADLNYEFNPTDMVYGVPPLTTRDVFNMDVYGDSEWRTLFELFEDKDTLCFFTRLTPVAKNRISRVTVDGVWKNLHRPTYISDDDGEIIGSKSIFSFIPNEGVPEPCGKWVMKEYRLEGRYATNLYGLCRIKKRRVKTEAVPQMLMEDLPTMVDWMVTI